MSRIWGSGPSDIWGIGGDTDSMRIYHFDGTAWSSAPHAATDMNDITGTSSGDVVLVGAAGTILTRRR